MRKKRNFISILLIISLVLTIFAGCGKQGADTGTGSTANNAAGGNVSPESGGAAAQGEQPADASAMGRYIEEVTDMSGRIEGYHNNIFRLADGKLVIADCKRPLLVSVDNGATWEEESPEWLTRMQAEDTYIDNINIGADGTCAVVYDGGTGDDFVPNVLIVKSDGTEIIVQMPLPEEELYLAVTAISDEGRVFINIAGSNMLYEVKEDGSCEAFLTLQNNVSLMQFQGNLLVFEDYISLYIYDVEKEEYVEDEVLEDFIEENYPDGNRYTTDDGHEMYFFAGEENILYLAGNKGLHRHVIGGSAIEQVIDGSLATFSNPAYCIEGMVMLDNQEFLALFNEGRLSRFTYDPESPTVPNQKLKIYSLKDNKTIHQAIALYQTANPEIYVEYKVGITEDSSITREDALKSLNTEIAAGEGPDVLVLDDLPIDSYREKGLLLDLTTLLNGLDGEEALFGNIVDSMKINDAVYAMPCEIQIPVVLGEEKYISSLGDLSGIADMAEQLRADYPGENLLDICTEKGIMRFFSMVCAPAWIKENGELDKDAVAEFLEQIKRVYDAQMDGLPEKEIERYERYNEEWLKEYGETRDDSPYLRRGESTVSYIIGQSKIARGVLESRNLYSYLISVNRMKGFENRVWRVLDGQSSHVYCAQTLLGINAASQNTDTAQEFVKLCLGKENQKNLFNGITVNKAAFEETFAEDTSLTDEDGAYLWTSVMSEEGSLLDYVSYWPSKEQTAELRSCIEAADTAYIENTLLEQAVFEEGAEYLQGRESLEEAVAAIEKQVALYMAE